MLNYHTVSLGHESCVATHDATSTTMPEQRDVQEEALTFNDIGSLSYWNREEKVAVPLAQALNIEARKASLAAVEGDPVAYAIECERQVAEVAGIVHGALVFDYGSPGRRKNVPPAVEDISPKNVIADCYGHTVVTSLALGQIGIPHQIVYMGAHAAVGLFNSSRQAYYGDPSNPRLSQDLAGIVSTGEDGPIPEQLTRRGRAVAAFHAERFRTNLDSDFNPDKPAYSWLSLGNGWRGEQVRLVMSVFTATEGRRVLAEHARYKRAIGEGDWYTAAESLVKLGYLYPELDAHTSSEMDDLQEVVVNLCADDHFRLANDAVAARLSATALSQDPRFADIEARCRKYILQQVVDRLHHSSLEKDVDPSFVSELPVIGLDAYVAARGCLRVVWARYEAANNHAKPPFSRSDFRKRQNRIRELGSGLSWWLADASLVEV